MQGKFHDVIPYLWDYNPSSWSQRVRVSLVALIGVIISAYMGLYQWKLIPHVWDPIFGRQTEFVLSSTLSHWMSNLFHLPDAMLGSLAYLGDIIFGLAGSTRRWQYRPWIVVIFGFDVIPLGVVSVLLVIAQGFIVKAWCFLCLVSAVISIILIILAYDEVWTSLVFLYKVYKRSKSLKTLIKTFWGFPTQIAYEVGEEMIQKRKKHVG